MAAAASAGSSAENKAVGSATSASLQSPAGDSSSPSSAVTRRRSSATSGVDATRGVDGAAIAKLSLVVNLTRHIHVRSAAGREDSGTEFGQFFPSFLWVVRDFSVKLERDGRKISAREYLEDALRPEDGVSKAVEQKNAVRMLIRNFFPERDCEGWEGGDAALYSAARHRLYAAPRPSSPPPFFRRDNGAAGVGRGGADEAV